MLGRHRDLLGLAAVVACIAGLLYAATTSFDFAYDDAGVVLRHPQVLNESWGALFASPYHVGPDVRVPTGAYRPLTIASLAANHAVSGVNPWSYHLVNVLLHAGAAALVLVLAFELGLPVFAALAGGLAFAVHPVHVEAVANVAGRAELLSSALALGALIALARGRLIAGSLLFGAGLFAKENVITLAGVVALGALLGVLRFRKTWTVAAAVLTPIAVYLAVRLAVLGRLGIEPGTVTAIENPTLGLPPLSHAATVLAVSARAVSLVVVPIRLSPDYGFAEIRPSASFLEAGPLLGAALAAGLVAGILWAWRRRPLVAFLCGSALVTYAIVSNAVIPIGAALGDRLLYLPSVFACLLFGLAAARAADGWGRRAAGVAAGAILVLLAVRAATYARVWRNDETLFAHAARAAPSSVRALGGWGRILAERGRLPEARGVLDRAVTIAPDFIPNRLNRGAAALDAGDLAPAEADALHVLALEPGNAAASRLLAAIRARRP